MTTDMNMVKIPTPAEYLSFVKNNDIAGAEAYLVEHFGVMGQEDFKEAEYNKFAEDTIVLVNEEAKAALATAEAAKKEDTIESPEVEAHESEVPEANEDGKAAD